MTRRHWLRASTRLWLRVAAAFVAGLGVGLWLALGPMLMRLDR